MVCTLRPDAIFEPKEHQQRGLVAYVHFETIYALRDRYVGRATKRRHLVEQMAKWRDPYIIALLLSMAQQQTPLSDRPRDSEGKAKAPIALVGIRKGRARKLCVYTVIMPDNFLAKFERPWEASECGQVVVRCQEISLKEPKEAARRLRLALMESVADLD